MRASTTASVGTSSGVDRRRFLTAAGVAAGVAWATPSVLSIEAAAAATCCSPSPVATVFASCQTNVSPITFSCTTYNDTTTTVCRRTRSQQMLLSRNSTGTQEPYFDDLGVLTITSPLGSVVTWNLIRWANTCRDNSATNDVTLTSTANQQCSTTTVAAVDITSMFGNECGVFQVRLRVRNGAGFFSNPYGWSQVFVVPV